MKESFTLLRDSNVFQNNLLEKILIKENELLKENKLYKKIYHNFESDPLAFDNTLCGLRSPLNIPDIEIGLEYFKEAIDKKSEILIIGDKDVDGVSSTALLSTFIKERHKGKLELIVSDAGDDYGLSGEVYERAIKSEAELIFLLDMGTSNGPEIENLYKKNKKVIILDHHLILDRSPDPKICAFLNPVRNLETHKFSHDGKIATVGLVFKFLFAFALSHIKEWNKVYVISNNEKLIAYRVGFYLGVFENISEVQKFLDTEYVSKRATQKISTISNFEIIQLHKENDYYKFKDNEWDCLVNNKLQGGRILISKIVNYRPKLKNFIIRNSDLAAIGIITDMVPLVDENRSLVKLGIGQSLYNFKKGTRDYRNGISALIKILGLNEERILSRDLGWGIGPALNAAGRMGNTILALELLNADTKISSAILAKKIINLNENRKRLTLRNELLIKTHFANNLDLLNSPIIFCYHPDLEKGVSGILATRLTEIYQKPVIYINNDGAYARGSARSWDGINVLDILDKLSSHFIQFGGHEQAAGFSITYENIPKFKKAIIEIDPKTLTKNSKQRKYKFRNRTFNSRFEL